MIENWIEAIIWSTIIFTITIILIKFSRRSINYDLRARDISKGHHWCYSGIISQVCFSVKFFFFHYLEQKYENEWVHSKLINNIYCFSLID